MDECYQLEALLSVSKSSFCSFYFLQEKLWLGLTEIGPNSLSEASDSSKVASQEWGRASVGSWLLLLDLMAFH